MKTKRVISALCGVAMLLTGFGLTSTTAVAGEEKTDQPTASQSSGGGDNQSQDQGITSGKSASDITINDNLTEDKAYVSKIKQVEVHDGTVPFDKDNERGDDSGKDNGIVRSFDRVALLRLGDLLFFMINGIARRR